MSISRVTLLAFALATALAITGVIYTYDSQQSKRFVQTIPVEISMDKHETPKVIDLHISEEITKHESKTHHHHHHTPKTRQQELIEKVKAKSFKSIAYVNRLYGYWPPATILKGLGIGSACYDVFILTFWMYGMTGDAVSVYADPLMFIGPDYIGNTKSEIQQNIQAKFHEQGSLLFISAFGAAQNPTAWDPVVVADSLAEWVNANPYIDGIDIDYEDNDAIVDGTGVTWLIAFQKALRAKLDNSSLLITHAPQAPYFSRAYYETGGYYTVDQEVGDTIDWYNIQFYNQGSTNTYSTYQNLFVESGVPFVNTAYQEILSYDSIPLSKLILGKPASTGDATNTGYMTPSDLAAVCNEGYTKGGIAIPGFFIWQFSTDQSCSFYNTFTSQYLYAGQ